MNWMPEIEQSESGRRDRGRPRWRTLSKLAELLGGEGFTENTARCVEYYFTRRSGLTRHQQKKIEERRKQFSAIMSALSPGDRLVVGKFIHQQTRMSFDAGLKIGLLAHATRAEAFRLGIDVDAQTDAHVALKDTRSELHRAKSEAAFYKTLLESRPQTPPDGFRSDSPDTLPVAEIAQRAANPVRHETHETRALEAKEQVTKL
jgi:hypothetical protein